MKTSVKILLLVAISAMCMNCKKGNDPTDPSLGKVPGLEKIYGSVQDKDGKALEGIRIEVYYNEALTEHYPNNDWYSMSEEYRKEHADKEPVGYTNQEGIYSVGTVARYDVKSLDIYVAAKDPKNVYPTQTKKGQIIYEETVDETGRKLVTGMANLNFVL